jgi:enoyl-CoA hydratase/carnithine racemase
VPRPITVAELVARTSQDDEGLVADDVPVLVIEPGGDGVEGLAEAVASLPAVLVGVADAAAADHLDVVVADDEALAAIVECVASSPVAAVALALLLRGRDALSVDQALVAESTTYSMLQGGPEFARWRSTRPAAVRRDEPGDAVLACRVGDVLRVTLNRPHRHNAYSAAVRDGLVSALRVAAADPAVHVVLDGAGPSFSSGGDLEEFGTFPDPATAHAVRMTRSAARLLARLADRVEAHVHGACLGAGVELPAFCGRVVARRDAYFGLPELSLGLVPGAGGTASLPPRIGRHRTMWMALTGRRIDAPTALSWGLVDEVVERFSSDG